MPKRSNKFQTLIYQIHKNFENDSDFEVTESKELINALTGEKREVDIVVEGRVGDVPVTIAFECTSQFRKADSRWVESMVGKHENLKTHRLVLVSESGFSKPALIQAEKAKFVEAVSLEDATEVDWFTYAKTFQQLTVYAFEFKLKTMTTYYQRCSASEQKIQSPKNATIRRLSDGAELNARAFGHEILRSPDVQKLATDRWHGENTPPNATGADFSIKWEPSTEQFDILEGTKCYPIAFIDLEAHVTVTHAPIKLNYKKFMKTDVAFAVLENPLSFMLPSHGNEMILAITKRDDKKPKVSMSFPKVRSGFQKTFVTTLVDEISNQKGEPDV